MRPLADPVKRFKAQYTVDAASGCWLWTGYVKPSGYGTLGVRVGDRWRDVPAHRFSYYHFVGPVESSLDLDHLCHNRDETCPGGWACQHRRCINPEHLEPVSRRVNLRRGLGFIGQNARKTHCPKGHPYSGDNLKLRRRGRDCRTCDLARKKLASQRAKGGAADESDRTNGSYLHATA